MNVFDLAKEAYTTNTRLLIDTRGAAQLLLDALEAHRVPLNASVKVLCRNLRICIEIPISNPDKTTQ